MASGKFIRKSGPHRYVIMSIHFATLTEKDAVVLYYDYLLTFPDELETVWHSRLSWNSALIGLSRYLSLSGAIPTLSLFLQNSNGPVSDQSSHSAEYKAECSGKLSVMF